VRTPFLVFIAALVWSGCERNLFTGVEDVEKAGQLQQVVVIDGFGDAGSTLTSEQLIRVGKYYDLSKFDSLWIRYTATRMNTDAPFDEVSIKIGPVHYLQDTLFAATNHVARSVRVSEISKAQWCAFSFITADARTVIRLTDLRVIGWMMQ
jgi:hypothetical protein